ncbi:MAG: T9SS type A sorting domain-containing protein [Bacteroidetes bacterium]|nr:T9SS type A sorting domain-containing protein [Bacteroidota bacterium]
MKCFLGIIVFLFVCGNLTAQATIEKSNPPKPIVLIYSDPTHTIYFISTGQEYAGADISSKVFDLSGRMLVENDIKGGNSYGVFVGNLSTGIYLVQVKSGNEIIGNQKISVSQKQ